mgnify:CR=1 FL=1
MPNRGWIVRGGLALLLAIARAPAPAQEPSPPAIAAAPAERPDAAVGELEERLHAVEKLNKELVERLERSQREHDEQMRLLMQRVDDFSTRLPRSGAGGEGDGAASATGTPSEPGGGTGGAEGERSQITGPIPEYEARLGEPPPFHTPASGLSTIASPSKLPIEVKFGPGFQFQTRDEEFLLQTHVESQIDARVWGDANRSTPFKDGFFFPRQRLYFVGHMTRPIEYNFTVNRGASSLDVLNAFLNLNLDDRFQLRFGRYFTPLGFDQFSIHNQWLPTPERSLFTANLGTSRQLGFMAWGHLFDKRLDYAAGLFTGPRNSFGDPNNSKDVTAFLNGRPFQRSARFTALKYWNVGTSVAYGYQDQPAVPLAFRVGAHGPTDSAASDLAAAPFLRLNPDVWERGERLLGAVHSALFYNGLSLMGEWHYGYENYASQASGTSAFVPVSGWYAAAAYFLTGEHVSRRAMVAPLHPLFTTRPGQSRGFGAWELVSRVSQVTLGRELFQAGLADPNVWTNSATSYELGVNWYWNEHMKIYMFWLHGDFNRPVFYDPRDGRSNVDMFWMRFQLYF